MTVEPDDFGTWVVCMVLAWIILGIWEVHNDDDE